MECGYPPCPDGAKIKGLCAFHYKQQNKGKPLAMRNYRHGVAALRNGAGEKRCLGCSTWQPVDAYTTSPSCRDGLSTRCRRCKRGETLRRRYGIGIEDYDALLESQNGRCAICGSTDARMSSSLHVDHDHATGKVRGILCGICNTRLGWLEANHSAVVQYLGRNR